MTSITKNMTRHLTAYDQLLVMAKGRCLFLLFLNETPGTKILSDCWKAYNRISKLDHNYKHQTVNHDLYFVRPDNPDIHTNTIESI